MLKHIFISLLFVLTGVQSVKSDSDIKCKIVDVKSDDCILRIEKSMLDRDFTIAARVEALGRISGRLRLSSGQRLNSPILVKLQVDDRKLKVIKEDDKNIYSGSDNTVSAYLRNSLPVVWKEFKIESSDDSTFTVNIGKLFTEQLEAVDPLQGRTAPGRLLASETRLLGVKSTSNSIEARISYWFDQNGEKKQVVLRKSLRVLPKEQMTPRISDDRINYGEILKTIYHTDIPSIEKKAYITRFRLTPSSVMKDGLVEPEKQIVFYVDSCFPEKWKPAIKAGIEDWNIAFEKIGYKNVIKAVDYPKEPSFDEYASGVNCFRYIVSDFPNAMGKYWYDPRSGEILEADVLFYSSVIDLLKKWYFLQTSSYNPLARNRELPDSVLNRLIRYASAHEIGHCLGLEHNFKASFAYDTDSLRSRSFTDKFGSTPSIMDYARMNYVAQPGDEVVNVYPPYIGETDMYAIKVGYKYLEKENDSIVVSWINEKQNSPLYRYDKSNPSAFNNDPSVMQTDIGNNPRVSGMYGIKNLRNIIMNISKWNPLGKNPFDGMPASYDDVMESYFRYINCMIPWIGGTYNGAAYYPDMEKEKLYVSAEESIATVDEVLSELENGYLFLLSPELVKYVGNNTENIISGHRDVIKSLTNENLFEHLAATSPKTGYGIDEYLDQLSEGILSLSDENIIYNNLQVNYLKGLQSLLESKTDRWYTSVLKESLFKHKKFIKKKYKKNKTLSNYLKTILL